MKLSIVVPCYNEQENIPLLLKRFEEVIKREDMEVILVDNGSTDESARVLSELVPGYAFARTVSVEVNQGYGYGILQGLEELKGEAPYNIELFGGGPADPNAPNFFTGAMSVLQPLIDDGTLVVVSGQTDFTQCATVDWDNSKAQSRMDAILAGNYSDIEIDGVLSPNDGIARAIITSCENAGQPIPVVSGLDAENESVEWVWSGRQYSTVAKPTNALVAETVSIIDSLMSGNGMPATDVKADNGVMEVPVYELPPVVVTKDNAKEVFADDPDRLALLKD